MDAAHVLDLLAHLQARDIPVWLDGGWAIDALLGEQTRPHDDLDVVARLEDSVRIENALNDRGFVLAGGGAPLSFELVDTQGHQVDVHPVSFTPDGAAAYRMADGADWIYPADGFTGVVRMLGREVPCLTPEVVMVSHTTGYALDEAHQRDVRALGERFGIALPQFARASSEQSA
jgi:lincosamide nucleotidyltransferase A/C/D/E